MKVSKCISVCSLLCFYMAFNACLTLAQQCGLPGLPPCPSKTTPKPTPKKTTQKPPTTQPKPVVTKPQPKPSARTTVSCSPSNNNDAPNSLTETINGVRFEFVGIPSGSFCMGSNDGDEDERPVHKVIISRAFRMGKTEVTQAQWRAVMGNNPSHFSNCGDDCPVENVSWEDAQDFLRRLNRQGRGTYRLPTEAEWEYAARAGSTTKYSYGDAENSLGSYAWYNENSGRKTHPVGQKHPNDWGLYDMHGNVWEWVQDWYGSYPSGIVTNPTGPNSGLARVNRGSSWYSPAKHLRSAFRDDTSPSIRHNTLGFRVVRQ